MAQDFVNLNALLSTPHASSSHESSNTPLSLLNAPAMSLDKKYGVLLLEILSACTRGEQHKRGLHKINIGLITKILTHNGIDIETRLISMMLNWKKAVGETYFQATIPQRYDKRSKKLYLHVKHSTWAQHLHMTRDSFIESLHQKLPQFQIEDIVAQFKDLTRRDWKQYSGQLAGTIRQYYRNEDKEYLLDFLAHKHTSRSWTPQDRVYCTTFLDEFLARQYKEQPLIKELVLFNAPASFMRLADDWEIHQQILKEEVLQKVDAPSVPHLTRETLQNVANTSQEIADNELRTAFTELMALAKQSNLEERPAPRIPRSGKPKVDSEASD